MKRWITKHAGVLSLSWSLFWLAAIAALTVRYHSQTDKALGDGVQQCRCICGAP